MIRTHKPLRTPTASPNLTSLAIKKDFCGDWGDPISFTLCRPNRRKSRKVGSRKGMRKHLPPNRWEGNGKSSTQKCQRRLGGDSSDRKPRRVQWLMSFSTTKKKKNNHGNFPPPHSTGHWIGGISIASLPRRSMTESPKTGPSKSPRDRNPRFKLPWESSGLWVSYWCLNDVHAIPHVLGTFNLTYFSAPSIWMASVVVGGVTLNGTGCIASMCLATICLFKSSSFALLEEAHHDKMI